VDDVEIVDRPARTPCPTLPPARVPHPHRPPRSKPCRLRTIQSRDSRFLFCRAFFARTDGSFTRESVLAAPVAE
jgi:hypothetical protein